MLPRIVKLDSYYFDWPIGTTRPASFAITEDNLSRYFVHNGVSRIANEAESQAVLNANQAGPRNRKLSLSELLQCYRDCLAYEQFHANAGVELLADSRN